MDRRGGSRDVEPPLGVEHRTRLALAAGEASDHLDLETTVALRYAHGADDLPLLDASGEEGDAVGSIAVHEFSVSLGSGLRF